MTVDKPEFKCKVSPFSLLNLFEGSLSSLFRRTDYKDHYKNLYHGKLVGHHHFDKAFQVYRFDTLVLSVTPYEIQLKTLLYETENLMLQACHK